MLRYTWFLLILVILLAVCPVAYAASNTPKAPVTGIGVSSGPKQPATPSKAPARLNPATEKDTRHPSTPLTTSAVLSIKRIYADVNKYLRVVIGTSTGKPLTPTVFNGMRLKLSASPQSVNANLRLTDLLQDKHTRTRANEVDFHTGVLFKRSGKVSAVLQAGAWKTDKSMLVTVSGPPLKTATAAPTASMAGASPAGRQPQMATPVKPVKGLVPAQIKGPAATMRARRIAGTATHPSTTLIDSGIRIAQPTESSHAMPGEALRVQYRFSRVASEGDIIFELVNATNIVLRTTRPYTPPASGEPDSETVTFTWLLPEELETGRNYFILATRGDAYGMSDSFSIGLDTVLKPLRETPEPTAIQVQTPRTGALTPPVVVRNVETDITWIMPGPMSLFTCANRVNLYAVRQADGERTQIRSRVDCDEGDNMIRWRPERFMTPGRYRVRVEADDGCFGESGTFRIDDCDYGIESVSLEGVGSLATGIDVRDSATVTGTFEVRVRWNGIPVPPNLPPGTTWDNRLTVLSTRTGANITHPAEGASFTYSDRPAIDGILLVRVPFAFPRDDIPAMRHGRHLPLEFRLQPFGASIDSDAANNTFNDELRVLGATDNDLRITIYPSDFSLTRRSHAAWSAPVWNCTFNQEVNLTNLAVTDAGGPASTLTAVPCRWEMQYRNDGGSDFHTFESGSFSVEHVSGGAWATRNIEGHFDVNPEITDRTYRLMVIADPDLTLMDPNRNNNRATVPFRLPD